MGCLAQVPKLAWPMRQKTMAVGVALAAITLLLCMYSAIVRSVEITPARDRGNSLENRLALLGGTSNTSAPYATSPDKESNLILPANYALLANVRCQELMSGDAVSVSKAKAFVSKNAAAFILNGDEALSAISCQELISSGYASFPASTFEEHFPLAFGIRMHESACQAELLLRAIYAPQNVYCVYIDLNSDESVVRAMRRVASCFSNVFLASVDQAFTYGSASPLRADMECMRLLLALPVKWRYFVNLTGQEMPLKTNYELVRILELYNGTNEIESEYTTIYEPRYKYHFWCVANDSRTVKCPEPRVLKPPLPGNVTIYKGLAYGYFSRALVEYVLDENSFARRLYDWFNDTYSPDENYWATLNRLPSTPGGYVGGQERVPPTSRAIIWAGVGPCSGTFVRMVCVFGVGDLPWLIGRPEAFANKLRADYDPLALQCLAEYLYNKRRSEWLHRDDANNSWLVPWYWSTYLNLPHIQQRRHVN